MHACTRAHTRTPTPSASHHSVSVTYSWPYSVHTDRQMLSWKLRQLFVFHGLTRKHLNRSWLQALFFQDTIADSQHFNTACPQDGNMDIQDGVMYHILILGWEMFENNGGSKLLDFCERMWMSAPFVISHILGNAVWTCAVCSISHSLGSAVWMRAVCSISHSLGSAVIFMWL